TKAHPDQLPASLKEVEGYRAYFASAERKGYSGVAIYTKREPTSVKVGFGVDEFDSEGRTLVADYGDFLLYSVYFPNGKRSKDRLDYKMRFYDAFLEHIDGQIASGRNVVICGDVNTAHRAIDLARPKQNAKKSGFLEIEREWIDKLLDHGHLDTFRMFNNEPGNYTYWDMITRARDRNVGWRIDYFYVSSALADKVTGAFILPEVMGSDHCPVGIDIEVSG
ncbi:MAG: exodeoxyribonuclease III, partial [Chloroflexi bacterium]|nr:exodeoxyribonuclease III [Chloroflexota bacterium]